MAQPAKANFALGLALAVYGVAYIAEQGCWYVFRSSHCHRDPVNVDSEFWGVQGACPLAGVSKGAAPPLP